MKKIKRVCGRIFGRGCSLLVRWDRGGHIYCRTGGFKVLVNGEEFVSDPPALAVDGRTYLPLRAMGEASRRSGELE